MMPKNYTIEEQLEQLIIQKNALEDKLKEKGVEVGENETLNTLVNKIDEIKTGGLNIHYGDTAPEDTSMLWVKTTKPTETLVSSTYSTAVTCSSVGSLPVGLYAMPAAVVGKYIYTFGGTDKEWDEVRTIYRYNTSTNAVSTLSTQLPTAGKNIAVGVVGTDIYLFGGWGMSGLIQKFDTNTNTLTTLNTKLPYNLYSIGVGVVGTDIYLFGGHVYNKNDYNTIYKFNTVSETLTLMPTTLPSADSGIPVGVIGTNIYLFTSTSAAPTNLYIYDTISGKLTKTSITNLSVQQMDVIGKYIYIQNYHSSGRQLGKIDTDTNKCYFTGGVFGNPGNDAHVVIGTDIYNIGGYNGNFTSAITKISDASLEENKLIVHSNTDTNLVDIIQGADHMEIGVTQVWKGNQYNYADLMDTYLYQDGSWVQIC